jgi:nucleotide-binding universal stress UspA family protein
MRTILLPVDFSERSLEAARQAKAIIRCFHSDLVVLSVLDEGRTSLHFESAGSADGDLQSYIDREFLGTPIRYRTRTGRPARAIVEEAEANAVDLIVAAGRARSPFENFATGSVTAGLLCSAPCPVWLSLHDHKGAPPLFHRILCCVDLSDTSDMIVGWGLEFARACDARCDVIHISPREDWRDEVRPTEDPLPRAEREVAERIKARLGGRGDLILADGELSKAVQGVAEWSRADLMVIGRSPAGNDIDRVHSKAYMIAHAAPCPVVSL